MHLSAEHGHIGNVSVLLEHNSNIHTRDTNEMIPLHLAEKGGHIKCVKLLKDAAGKCTIIFILIIFLLKYGYFHRTRQKD